ncbi:MAG TPA: glycosyltransferase family 87 protein [Pyrinomonadaceae bacterium]|nr:glycosyltransferase family 87 protein [Pyrinomonadaceae bacterium]
MKEGRTGEPRVVASTHASTDVDVALRDDTTTRGEAASRVPAMGSATWTTLLLVALGLASLALYRYGLNFDKAHKLQIVWFIKLALSQCALYAAAAWVVWRAPRGRRSTLALVFVFAALFRLSVLFAPPFLSDDVYRYVWDGRVQAAGINPYAHVPADSALVHLRDANIYPNINRRDYAPTIYPPLAQIVFFLTTRVSEQVVWMKFVLVLFEAAGLFALSALLASFGVPRELVLLAAWHPLAVWEIAGSGHLDALVVCFVALALLARQRKRDGLTGAFLASAVLVKLFPLVLLPAFYRRGRWRLPLAFCLTLAAGYLPYLSVGARRVLGFLPGYASEEGLQSGERFFLLQLARALFGEPRASVAAYAVFALLVMCALAAWCVCKRDADERDCARRAALLATVFTVLLSPHYTWYFVWLVVFLCVLQARQLAPLLCLTAASFMLYGTWLGDSRAEMLYLNLSIYLPPAVLLVFSYLRRRAAVDNLRGAT